MRALTIKQREALEKVEIVRDQFARRFWAELYGKIEGAVRPSEWVNQCELETTHHVDHRALKALVKKGFLESRGTDGWGDELRVKDAPFHVGDKPVYHSGSGNQTVLVTGVRGHQVEIDDVMGRFWVDADELSMATGMRADL